MLVLQRMLSYPVWPQSIPILPPFLPSSAPHSAYQGVQEHFLLGLGWADSQTVRQTHRKSWKCCRAQCLCWQTPHSHQTANMLKMLPLQRSAVALHYIIQLGIAMEGQTEEENELIQFSTQAFPPVCLLVEESVRGSKSRAQTEAVNICSEIAGQGMTLIK